MNLPRILIRALIVLVVALVLSTFVTALRADANTNAKTYTVRLVAMEFPSAPAPTHARVNSLFAYAQDYWEDASDGAISLVQDGSTVTAVTDSPDPYGADFRDDFPAGSPDVYFIVSNIPNNGFSFSVRGNPGQVFINNIGDTRAAAHEFGHIFGLGHSHALLRTGSDNFWADYGNEWSVMGSGRGVPDGAQMELLGLMNQEVLGDDPRTAFLRPMGSPERNSFCWKSSTSPAEYCAEYRKRTGLDADVDRPARVLVYRTEYDGYHTFLYEEMTPGDKHLYGGMWVHVRSTGTTAKVTFTRRAG